MRPSLLNEYPKESEGPLAEAFIHAPLRDDIIQHKCTAR